MEAQIKEEVKDACLESPEDNELASLTLIEKYDKYLLGQDLDSEADSDDEYFPNETMLREEYAQMRRDTNHYMRSINNHRLSLTLPSKYKNLNENDISVVVDDEPRNGSKQSSIDEGANSSTDLDNIKTSTTDSDIASLDKLIEQLNKIRKFETDWKTISCTEEELESISELYGQILDYIYTKSITSFERSTSSKDLETQQNEEVEVEDDDDDDVKETNNENQTTEHSEDKKLLAEKIKLVKIARDKYYEVEQQVREHIEQLELVERYKMESVG